MKTDIALHEIMRIDEQDDTHAEHSTIADPTQADADRPTLGQPFMKSEEAPTGTVEDDMVATDEALADVYDDLAATEAPSGTVDDDITEEAPTGTVEDDMLTTEEAPISTGDEMLMTEESSPSNAEDIIIATEVSVADPVEDTAVAEKSPASRPDDTTAAQPVMSLHDTSNLQIPAPAMSYDESSIGSTATPAPESTIDYNQSPTESAEDMWLSIQTKTSGFFDTAVGYTAALYKNNRQLLTTLGIVFLAILTTKLLVAGLNAVDDIPLVAPILKLIGLVYTVRFVWRYLLREQDRHELAEKIDSTKAEIFGGQN